MRTIVTILLAASLSMPLGCSKKSGDASSKTARSPVVQKIIEKLDSNAQATRAEALSEATQYLQEKPNDVQAKLLYAVANLKNGNAEAALSEGRRIKSAHPSETRADALVCTALIVLNRFQEAVDIAKPLAESKPQDKHIQHILAVAYLKLGDQMKAQTHLATLKSIDPEYDGVPVSLDAFIAFIKQHDTKILFALSSIVKLIAM